MWQVLFDIQLGRQGEEGARPTRGIGFSVDLRASHVDPTYLGNAFVGVFALPPSSTSNSSREDALHAPAGRRKTHAAMDNAALTAQLVDMARSIRAATQAARDPHVGRCLLDLVHAPTPTTTLHTLLSVANVQHMSVGQVTD